jgi:L-alanine-DL-glutamate epimerase-like enolase superfamily enzyme
VTPPNTGNQTYADRLADEVVTENTQSITDGCQAVLIGPGLGVTLDRGTLNDYAERYRLCGAFA